MNKIIGLILSFFFMSFSWGQTDSLPSKMKKDSILLSVDTLINVIDSTKNADSLVLSGKVIKGIASFYSANLDGTKTATGEVFRNSKFTGASNNLKLNTWVKVTNLKNGKTVVVRINDRMHPKMKKKGRVIDLSRAAAKKLDFIEDGLTKVKLEVIDNPKK
jgi:rare lipoprotein A (peptidoglycan hydrolase)